MKLLALVTDAFGAPGGIAQYNRDLLLGLQSMPELESIVVLPRHGRVPIPRPKKIKQLPQAAGRLHYALEAWRQTRAHKPDAIFCGHLYMLPLAALLGWLHRSPVWLQVHGIDAWHCPNALTRLLTKRLALVTSVSRHTREQFLRWSNVDPQRVKVLPNTVAPEFKPIDRNAVRQVLQVQVNVVLLTVGRLAAAEAYKGHDRVLRCLPQLLRGKPELLYLIAGTGDDQPRLAALAIELGVAAHVRFLGAVGADALPGLYAAADLFVMPSTGEGFGIVFLEAMACGTPALGLGGDGSRDPLRDGNMGTVATEATLCQDIQQALAAGRPKELATLVQNWFGHDAFRSSLASILRAWSEWRTTPGHT